MTFVVSKSFYFARKQIANIFSCINKPILFLDENTLLKYKYRDSNHLLFKLICPETDQTREIG